MIAVDQSTSASKIYLVNEEGKIVKSCSGTHQQYFPKPGYVEHDAEEIWQNVRTGIAAMLQQLSPGDVAAISISNQRETTVFWDVATGRPSCRAIVWQDVRAQELCKDLQAHEPVVREKTGLALSAYYPAGKAAHALRANSALRRRVERGEVMFGTVDSYLIYRLTGGNSFCTDVTNASRTSLYNLHTMQWDAELFEIFGLPMIHVPEVLPSDSIFGTMKDTGIPIIGVMGDSHAALFAHGCGEAGMLKATFGTGSSVMMNAGLQPVASGCGLSSSVGFGCRGQTHFVLEGNVTCCGDVLCWLRDEMGLISSIEEAEKLARSVTDTQGVYLVPAFSGLGAPSFDSSARAVITGMNRGTTRAHIVRAALESMAYQDAAVIQAMSQDTGLPIRSLCVDGGPTSNRFLMQLLSDLTGAEVRCSSQRECSALGVAWMGGITAGIWSSREEIPAAKMHGIVYQPRTDERTRKLLMEQWQRAVSHCKT